MFLDGVVAPDRGALALERQADHPAGALRVLLGHRGVDLGALEEDRAEHVLLGAVLLAGDQRQGRVVVAAQRVLRGAVQRRPAPPAARSGRCSAGSAGPAAMAAASCRVGRGRAAAPAGAGTARRRCPPGPGPGAGRCGRRRAWVGAASGVCAAERGERPLDRARPDRRAPCGCGRSAAAVGRGGRPGRPGPARRGPGRRGRRRCGRDAGRRAHRAAAAGGAAATGPPMTSRNRSCAVWPERAGLLALLAGHRDRQVGAVEHHLGAADAEPVDPLLDDLLRLQQLLAGRFGAGLGAGDQRDPGAALQVDAQLGRGPAVAGEEHQRVQHDDDADERGQVAPGTDPPRGGCHGSRSLPATVAARRCRGAESTSAGCRSASRPSAATASTTSARSDSGVGSARRLRGRRRLGRPARRLDASDRRGGLLGRTLLLTAARTQVVTTPSAISRSTVSS